MERHITHFSRLLVGIQHTQKCIALLYNFRDALNVFWPCMSKCSGHQKVYSGSNLNFFTNGTAYTPLVEVMKKLKSEDRSVAGPDVSCRSGVECFTGRCAGFARHSSW